MRLWLWSLLEFVVLAALAIARAKLWTYGSDTGTFAQIVADAFGGMRNGVEAGSHFRYHWSPSLALLWPLVATTRSALPLQFVQAAATVVCGPLIALLARPYVGQKLADRLGLLTLLYPPLLALGFDEFHELGLFTPLVLALVLCADRRWWTGFAVCAVVAIGLREDAALTLVFFGAVLIAIALHRQARGRGVLDGFTPAPRELAIAGGSLAFAAVAAVGTYYAVITPRLGGWVPSHFYVYSFASGPLALVASRFHPPAGFRARDLDVRPVNLRARSDRAACVFAAALLVVAAGASGRRDRLACKLGICLANGRPLRRALDPMAARRDRNGRRLARAARCPGRCRTLDRCSRGSLRRLLDRVRSAASAALSSFLLRRSGRRSPRRSPACRRMPRLPRTTNGSPRSPHSGPARRSTAPAASSISSMRTIIPTRRFNARIRPALAARGCARRVSRHLPLRQRRDV